MKNLQERKLAVNWRKSWTNAAHWLILYCSG